MTDDSRTSERSADRSPVIALLFAQYNSVQRERLVVATTMRILWFILLLVFGLAPDLTFEDVIWLMVCMYIVFVRIIVLQLP